MNTTDSNGVIDINLQFKQGYIGKYIIQIDFCASSNLPIYIEYKNPVESIDVIGNAKWKGNLVNLQIPASQAFIVKTKCLPTLNCSNIPIALMSTGLEDG